jgi:hypothetical protein
MVGGVPDPVETPPDDAQLARMYGDGSSVRAIAAVAGVAPKTIHRRLKASGVRLRPPGGGPRRAPRRPLDRLDVEAITSAYQGSPVSLETLGAQYGRSGDAIARLLRRHGVPVRPRGRPLSAGPAPGVPDDLISFHEQGLRPADIAARLPGADPARIARALRGAGRAPHRARPLPAASELAAAYAAAGSVRALARRLHADENRIRRALAAAGVPAGSLRLIPPELRGQAARLAAQGAAAAHIAGQAGLSEEATCRLGRPLFEAARPSDPACRHRYIASTRLMRHYRSVLSI